MKKKPSSRRACRAGAAAMIALILTSPAALGPAASPARPRILGVSHIAFYVHDVDAARRFYRNVLGFADSGPLSSGNRSRGPAARIVVNDRQYIEIVPEREAGSDRLVEVALQTDNVEAMRGYLKSRGLSVPDGVRMDEAGNRAFSVTDPDGHVVVFAQHARDGRVVPEDDKGTPAGSPPISSDMRHIGILVGALEPAMQFYRDGFGFKEIWRGSRDEKELNWVNMQVPDGEDYIEFMLYRDLPEPSKRGTQHHICLFVPDIERAAARLRERAASAGYTRPMEIRVGTNRKRQLNLYDPDGTRTELMEPATIDGKPAPSSTAPPPRSR